LRGDHDVLVTENVMGWLICYVFRLTSDPSQTKLFDSIYSYDMNNIFL